MLLPNVGFDPVAFAKWVKKNKIESKSYQPPQYSTQYEYAGALGANTWTCTNCRFELKHRRYAKPDWVCDHCKPRDKDTRQNYWSKKSEEWKNSDSKAVSPIIRRKTKEELPQ